VARQTDPASLDPGDCDEINGNYIRVPVTWSGKCEVSSLAGKRVKLRYVMRDTKLYSFQFLAAPKSSGP